MILPIFSKKDVVVKLFNGEVETAYEGYEAQNCEFSLTGNGKIFNTTLLLFPTCKGGGDIVDGMKVYHKDKIVLEGGIPKFEITRFFQPTFEVGSITNQYMEEKEVYNCSVCGEEVLVDHINPPVFNCGCKGATALAEMEAVAIGKSSFSM